jgi:cell division protease FtsH
VVAGQILETSPVLALFETPALVWQALPLILQLAFAFFFIAFQFIGLFWLLSRGGVDTYYPDDIKTRFTDVWGQDHVVQRIRENIMFLEKPDEIEAKGGYVPGGLLLWGPPGTGKTLMAEAVAGETGRPYVFVDPGAFINMFMGVGILKVKSLFRKLRKLSLRYGGVIVFFDEADALGNRGSLGGTAPGGTRGMRPPAFAHAGCHGFSYLSEDTRSLLTREAMASSSIDEEPVRRSRFVMGGAMNGGGGGMGTLQALLTELSGLKKPRGILNRWGRRALGMRPKPPPKYRILVMMATNMPESLDEALLRPGRIDRIYRVGYPSKAGRIRTYQGYLDKVPHEVTDDEVDKLATITPYATGATIKDLVNEALITAIRDGREIITWRDVMKAKQLKDLGPPEDVEYIERERHAVAVHEACHAVMAYRTRRHMEIDLATIEKGSDYLGMVASIPPEDQFTRWRSEYDADILVSLASLAGERMFFEGDSSSGVSGDLESATAVASFMEGYWGMGHTVSSYSTTRRLEVGSPGGGRGGPQKGESTENKLRAALADRIEDKLEELLDRAEQILEENRFAVLAIAHALETHKTLNGEDVEAVIEGREGASVDGRVYRDQGFLNRLEEYHHASAGAHRGHTAVTLTMPAGGHRVLPPAAEGGDTAASTAHEPPR